MDNEIQDKVLEITVKRFQIDLEADPCETVRMAKRMLEGDPDEKVRDTK